MSESVKITSLQLENVKRVRAVALSPTENGLTILGGRNGQGKTSVLDAIAWALGGDRYKPTDAARDGSVLPPHISLTLSNGLVVERKGKNSALTVTDPEGKRYGQKLLDAFVSTFAIDLPKFLQASDKDKAETLLKVIGVGDQLRAIERECQEIYSRRHAIGQIAEQKSAHARELPYHDEAPDSPVSAGELIRQQQEIMLRNAENARMRARKEALARQVEDTRIRLEQLQHEYDALRRDLALAERDALDLHDESTAELEENIRKVDAINAMVRDNMARAAAEEEAKACSDQYNDLTVMLEERRVAKRALLDNANLPLPGLTVEDGILTYHGHRWDCMSSSEQLIVGTAIARAINPHCGFVLLDKLEQLDTDTLQRFHTWLCEQGLQAIATRVSTGGECTIIIEDGEVQTEQAESPKKAWKAGEF